MDIEQMAKKLNGLKANETLYYIPGGSGGVAVVEDGGSCKYVNDDGFRPLASVHGPLTVQELFEWLQKNTVS
jgi:hypothetical protein